MCCFRIKKRCRDDKPWYGGTTIFSFVMFVIASAAVFATGVAGAASTSRILTTKPHEQHHKAAGKPQDVEISSIEKVPSFVINLEGEGGAGRLEFFSHHVGKKRHMFQNMCRFNAVDMRKCTDPEKHEKFIKPPVWDMNRRPGAHLGCGMSHRSLWQHIVDNKIPVAVVMEDDVHRFSDDFDALYKEAMASLLKRKQEGTAWHVFRFAFLYDNNHWINREHLNAAKNLLMLNKTIPRRWVDDCHYPRFYQHFVQDLGTTPLPFWAFGSGMYAITYEGAKEALSRFNALTDTVDSFAWAPKTNCYLPAIATADGNGTTRFAPNAVVRNFHFRIKIQRVTMEITRQNHFQRVNYVSTNSFQILCTLNRSRRTHSSSRGIFSTSRKKTPTTITYGKSLLVRFQIF